MIDPTGEGDEAGKGDFPGLGSDADVHWLLDMAFWRKIATPGSWNEYDDVCQYSFEYCVAYPEEEVCLGKKLSRGLNRYGGAHAFALPDLHPFRSMQLQFQSHFQPVGCLLADDGADGKPTFQDCGKVSTQRDGDSNETYYYLDLGQYLGGKWQDATKVVFSSQKTYDAHAATRLSQQWYTLDLTLYRTRVAGESCPKNPWATTSTTGGTEEEEE